MLHTILIKTKCSHIRLSSPMGCADEESEDDDKVFSHDRRKVFAVMGCGRKWMKEAWFFAEQKFRSQTQVSEAAETNECDCGKCSTPMIAP